MLRGGIRKNFSLSPAARSVGEKRFLRGRGKARRAPLLLCGAVLSAGAVRDAARASAGRPPARAGAGSLRRSRRQGDAACRGDAGRGTARPQRACVFPRADPFAERRAAGRKKRRGAFGNARKTRKIFRRVFR